MEINDDVLINLIRQNNKEAYNLLFHKYHKMVAFWVNEYHRLLLANRLCEDDIIYMVLSKFEYCLDQYDFNFGHFKKYMKSITEREIFKVLKLSNTAPYKAVTTSFSLDETIKDVEDRSYASVISSSYYINEFESHYDTSTLMNQINEFLGRLNEDDKKIYYMYIYNKNYKMIAAQLGISVKKVDNTIYKIKKRLLEIKDEYENK